MERPPPRLHSREAGAEQRRRGGTLDGAAHQVLGLEDHAIDLAVELSISRCPTLAKRPPTRASPL